MAGHSKWANIQHRKGRQDAKRASSGPRSSVKSRWRPVPVAPTRTAIRGCAWPGTRRPTPTCPDNIQRAIQRGAGGADGEAYEEVRYEGYGIGGAAVIVDCMTDNRTRTVAEVRHAFAKNGGNLGQEGSVAFMFKHCGQFVFAPAPGRQGHGSRPGSGRRGRDDR